MLTHREARKKMGSRTVRRSGTKTQIIPSGGKVQGKGAMPKWRNPRRFAKTPTLAARVWAIVEGRATR